MLLITQLFAFMACSHPSLGCDLFQSCIKPSLAGQYLDVTFSSLSIYGYHGKWWHTHLRSTTEPQNELILTVLAEVLSLGWDKGSIGCTGWGNEEISFYKHYCDRCWEIGRHEWEWGRKETTNFLIILPWHPWIRKNGEEWGQRGVFSTSRKLRCFLDERQWRAKNKRSVHCSGYSLGQKAAEFWKWHGAALPRSWQRRKAVSLFSLLV